MGVIGLSRVTRPEVTGLELEELEKTARRVEEPGVGELAETASGVEEPAC